MVDNNAPEVRKRRKITYEQSYPQETYPAYPLQTATPHLPYSPQIMQPPTYLPTLYIDQRPVSSTHWSEQQTPYSSKQPLSLPQTPYSSSQSPKLSLPQTQWVGEHKLIIGGPKPVAKTCVRAIVKDTTCSKVETGMLFVFTCMGGSIGREGSHDALLPELSVSKRHASIFYCSDSSKYYIKDEGTMNGTYLNSTRISPQKKVSERVELSHLDEVKIGSTVLQIHIHTNLDTCSSCEPGLVKPAQPNRYYTYSKTRRNQTINSLKWKYNLKKYKHDNIDGDPLK